MNKIAHAYNGPYVVQTVITWGTPLSGDLVEDVAEHIEKVLDDVQAGANPVSLRQEANDAEQRADLLAEGIEENVKQVKAAVTELNKARAWFAERNASIPALEAFVGAAIDALTKVS